MLEHSIDIAFVHLLLILLLNGLLLLPVILTLRHVLLTHVVTELVLVIVLVFKAVVRNITVLLLELPVLLVELVDERLDLVAVVGLLPEHHLLRYLGLLLRLLHHRHCELLGPFNVLFAIIFLLNNVFDHLHNIYSIDFLNHLESRNEFLCSHLVQFLRSRPVFIPIILGLGAFDNGLAPAPWQEGRRVTLVSLYSRDQPVDVVGIGAAGASRAIGVVAHLAVACRRR